MRDRKCRDYERQMDVTKHSHLRHLAIFGRPLWSAYTDVQELISVARRKILGGESVYSSSDKY